MSAIPIHELNEAQRRAVGLTAGPGLVIAGAGTGKTRVLTTRIVHLLEQGVAPSRILAVTFSRKAARELSARVEHLVGTAAAHMQISTFHALGLHILREQAECRPRARRLRVLAGPEQVRLVRALLASMGEPNDEAMVAGVLRAVSVAKNRDGSPVALDEPGQAFLVRYEENLHGMGVLDFDDLVLRPIKLMEERPEVASYYQGRWKHVLVDEYQDTSRGQHRLMRSLIGPERNIFVVGDDDQSVYGFRGAEVDRILEFPSEFAGCQTVTLEVNYRSREPIVGLANEVIAQARRRFAKRLRPQMGQGPLVEWIATGDEIEERMWLAEKVAWVVSGLRVDIKDIAILVRVRSQLSNYREGLEACGLPCVVGEPSMPPAGVRLMTLHQAKGLEFRVVFLPAVEDRLLPHFHALGEDAVEEELRLFYVGITRARDRLFLSSSSRRKGHAQIPSRFLSGVRGSRYLVCT